MLRVLSRRAVGTRGRAVVACAIALAVGGGVASGAVAFSPGNRSADKTNAAAPSADRAAILRAEKRVLARLHAQIDPLRRDGARVLAARRKLLRDRHARHLYGAPTTPDPLARQFIRDQALSWSIMHHDANPSNVSVYSSSAKAAAFAIDGTIEMVDPQAPVYVAVIDGSFVSGALPGPQNEAPQNFPRMVVVFDATTLFERELAYVSAQFNPSAAFGRGLALIGSASQP